MESTTVRRSVGLLAAVTYLLMVTVNVLANTLPINGIRTGEVSDAYPNLFAPAGYAFSIWGMMYLLLGLHVLYQLGLFRARESGGDRSALLNKAGGYFSISSLANTAWVFAWHYDVIALSVVLIVVILVCLAAITRAVAAADPTVREKLLIGVPFSVYLGWITVATVANITVFLVSINWDGFGFADSPWVVVVLLVATAIGTVTMLRNRDIGYGLVLLWAYRHPRQTHLRRWFRRPVPPSDRGGDRLSGDLRRRRWGDGPPPNGRRRLIRRLPEATGG